MKASGHSRKNKMNKSTMSDEELNERREKTYKQISRSYTLLRKLSQLEDAKKMVESIWRLKKEALEIELEILKRETG